MLSHFVERKRFGKSHVLRTKKKDDEKAASEKVSFLSKVNFVYREVRDLASAINKFQYFL